MIKNPISKNFFNPGIKRVSQGGSSWEKLKTLTQNVKENLPEAIKSEGVEALLGATAVGVLAKTGVMAAAGANPAIIVGLATFGVAVAYQAIKNSLHPAYAKATHAIKNPSMAKGK